MMRTEIIQVKDYKTKSKQSMIDTIKKTDRDASINLNIFLIGYVLYSVAFVLERSTPPYLVIIAEEIFSFIGICLIFYALLNSIKLKGTTNGYVKLLLALLIIWTYVLIVWSLELDFDFIKVIIFQGESSLLTYFVPLVVLMPNKILFLKKTMTAVVILGLVFFLYIFLFRDTIFKVYGTLSVTNEKYLFEYCAKWLSLSAGFLVLTFSYQSKKVKFFVVLLILTTLVIALFRARRAMIFMTLLPVIIASAIYIFRSRYKLFALLLAILMVFGIAVIGLQLYSANQNGFFSNLSSRVDEDSRSKVEECLYNDFTFKDWIIGRGLDGRYFCPNIDDNYEVVGYRPVIETDYLNIILKSGSIYLVFLLMVMLPAIYKGLFRSQNVLSKAAGTWILFWIICLYPANVFGFSLNYLLVWISIGICYSKEIRNMPGALLKDYFLKTKDSIDS